jgi:hypothetical protein
VESGHGAIECALLEAHVVDGVVKKGAQLGVAGRLEAVLFVDGPPDPVDIIMITIFGDFCKLF